MKKQTSVSSKLSKEDSRVVEKLKCSINNCLDTLSDYDIEHSISINNDKLPSELIKSCITISKDFKIFENKQPLRIIKHFSCAGRTIISNYLLGTPNTLLINNLNPLSSLSLTAETSDQTPISPTDFIQRANKFNCHGKNKAIIDIITGELAIFQRWSTEHGKYPILSEITPDCWQFDNHDTKKLDESIKRKLPVLSTIIASDPIDSYLSLIGDSHTTFQTTFEEFCKQYTCFLNRFSEVPIIKTETFYNEPDQSFANLCKYLQLPNSRPKDIGNTPSPQNKKIIRRSDYYLLEAQSLKSYRQLCSLLDYQLDLKYHLNTQVFIVTPSLNSSKFIGETIKTVVTQKGNFKIIYHIQDGGSEDKTIEIIKKWQKIVKGNQRIALSFDSSSDNGMYDAIQKGFKLLNPPDDAVCTWINSDDLLVEDSCRHALSAFSINNDINWLVGNISVCNEAGKVQNNIPQHYPQEIIASGLCDGKHWRFIQQEGSYWKASLWNKVGGLNTKLKLCGDWDLWRRFAKVASPVHFNNPLGRFRSHDGQLTSTLANYYSELDECIEFTMRKSIFETITLGNKICTISEGNNKYECSFNEPTKIGFI